MKPANRCANDTGKEEIARSGLEKVASRDRRIEIVNLPPPNWEVEAVDWRVPEIVTAGS